MTFTYEATTPSEFLGEVNLLPSGYWKYEVYEVSWIGTVSINSEQAPATEKESIEPIGDDIGVVQGLVTKGKLNLSDYKGTSQVQYKEHETEEGTNYIYYGQ